jgi:hypothetical protein
MENELQESTKQLVYQSVGIGIGILALGGIYCYLVIITRPIAEFVGLFLTAVFMVFVFGVNLPTSTYQSLRRQRVDRGRYFIGCSVGLYVAFIIGILAVYHLGPFLIQLDVVVLTLFLFLTFLIAGMNFSIGYRYHRLTELTQPDPEPFFSEQNQILIVGGAAVGCLCAAIILGFMSRFFTGEIMMLIYPWWPIIHYLGIILLAIAVLLTIIAVALYFRYTT